MRNCKVLRISSVIIIIIIIVSIVIIILESYYSNRIVNGYICNITV